MFKNETLFGPRRFLVQDAFWSKRFLVQDAFGYWTAGTGPKRFWVLDCYGTANIVRNANLVRNASLARNRYFGPKPFSGPKPLSGPKPHFGKKPLLGINWVRMSGLCSVFGFQVRKKSTLENNRSSRINGRKSAF